MALRIGIVCSIFNSEITDRMLDAAKRKCEKHGIIVSSIHRVPGAFDIPLVAKKLAERKDVDAVVTLGAIVKGETDHDEIIATALAVALHQISLLSGKPVLLGVSGPGMTWEEGMVRAVEYAERAVDAAVMMHNEISGIDSG